MSGGALRSDAVPGVPIVTLIDGRSGSGKTTLAAEIAAELGAQILPVESLYPGWDGLAEGSASVAKVLDRGWYRRYDWVKQRFAETIRLSDAPLVIEGCGALTRKNLAAAERWATGHFGNSDRSVLSAESGIPGRRESEAPHVLARSYWLEMGETARRARALARDGDTFAPHWDRWAAQEATHYALHKPWLWAGEFVQSK